MTIFMLQVTVLSLRKIRRYFTALIKVFFWSIIYLIQNKATMGENNYSASSLHCTIIV